MSKKEFNIWMVRAGSGSFLLEEFLEKEIIAIGWNELGAIAPKTSNQALRQKIITTYDNNNAGQVGQSLGQLWRFYHDFKIGDKVVTYDSSARKYYLGEIISGYNFNEKLTYKHARKVRWNEEAVGRDLLKVASKNTLGSTLTIFELSKGIWNDLVSNLKVASKDKDFMEATLDEDNEDNVKSSQQNITESNSDDIDDALEELRKDVVSKSTEFIKDMIFSLNWEDVELLVAGVLRGMGYKTRLTGKGPDLGSDIIASTDGLEMVEPIIKVEVKHKKTNREKIGAPDLRNFIGGLRTPTKGIYVSTTGFSKDAKIEADRANYQITLVDLDRLVDLIVEYYEKLDSETKAFVPLRKIYWPI